MCVLMKKGLWKASFFLPSSQKPEATNLVDDVGLGTERGLRSQQLCKAINMEAACPVDNTAYEKGGKRKINGQACSAQAALASGQGLGCTISRACNEDILAIHRSRILANWVAIVLFRNRCVSFCAKGLVLGLTLTSQPLLDRQRGSSLRFFDLSNPKPQILVPEKSECY